MGCRARAPDRLPRQGPMGCRAKGGCLLDGIAAPVASSQARVLPTVHVVHVGRVQHPDPT